MDFRYRARSTDGGTRAGTLAAADLADARRQLRARGLFPTEIEAEGTAVSRGRPSGGGGRVSREQLADVTAEMALMIRAGVDVAESIRAVAERSDGTPLAAVMNEVYDTIESGASASAAFATRRDVFGDAYVASVAAGEASGQVADVFERLAELLRHELELASTVRGLLAYPLVLVGACGVVLTVTILFVLPQFAGVFDDFDKAPPPLTVALLGLSEFLRGNLATIGVATGIAAAAAVAWLRSAGGRLWVDDRLIGLPKVGPVARKLLTARLFRQLGTLLGGGLPLLDAVRLCRVSTGHSRFRRLLDEVEADILAGGSMSPVLARSPQVPPGAARMVSAAEASGKLADVVDDVGRRYEADGRRELTALAKIAEPAVILVMGLVVGGIVMSVMLPLLDMTTSAGAI